jgi:hypothetical protein
MLPVLILSVLTICYRLAYALAGSPGWWANFSPLAAVVLCSGVYLTRKSLFLIPVLAIIVSDLILNAHYHVPLLDTRMLSGYFALAIAFCIGLWISKQHSYRLLFLLGGSILGSILFYLVTNTVDWYLDSFYPPSPLPVAPYPKTFAGWVQALTTGVPGFPPTILFFRNTLISDLFFTFLIYATQALSNRFGTRAAAPSVGANASITRSGR